MNAEVTRRNFPMIEQRQQHRGQWHHPDLELLRRGQHQRHAPQPAATAAQCAAINALLPRFYGQIPRTLGQELYFGKLDYHLSERSTLSASFNFLHDVSPNGIASALSSTSGSALTGNGDDFVTVRNGRVAWTFVPTSSFVNELRLGWPPTARPTPSTSRRWDKAWAIFRYR